MLGILFLETLIVWAYIGRVRGGLAAAGALVPLGVFLLVEFTPFGESSWRTVVAICTYLIPLVICGIYRGGSYLHERKDGGADRRFNHNPYQYSFPEPIRDAAGIFGAATLVLALVSVGLAQIEPTGHVQISAPDMAEPHDLGVVPDLAPAPDLKRHHRRRAKPSEE